MRRQDFHYDLPPELIAQSPLPSRSASRLLALDGGEGTLRDLLFVDLPGLLSPGDLLVFNDTRVLNARLLGHKPSGGRVELLLERLLAGDRGLFQARASKSLRAGSPIQLDGGGVATVLGRDHDLFEIAFDQPIRDYLARHGDVPLPPYIARHPEATDRERYQTVFARVDGAVAAPTAGLHFDVEILDVLRRRGIRTASITLHVGAGTFQPVRVDSLEQHRMHAESVEVGADAAQAIVETRRNGGDVVAVGTTVMRALESAWKDGAVRPFSGDTTLFIRPGYRFNVADALLTNFHLPESTLLMLVCAYGGFEATLRAYAHAVRESYRFFSYGDAMWIRPDPAARPRSRGSRP
jgi:S-adenosylmethionine:tRNA ribosyltransferase-isomerase